MKLTVYVCVSFLLFGCGQAEHRRPMVSVELLRPQVTPLHQKVKNALADYDQAVEEVYRMSIGSMKFSRVVQPLITDCEMAKRRLFEVYDAYLNAASTVSAVEAEISKLDAAVFQLRRTASQAETNRTTEI